MLRGDEHGKSASDVCDSPGGIQSANLQCSGMRQAAAGWSLGGVAGVHSRSRSGSAVGTRDHAAEPRGSGVLGDRADAGVSGGSAQASPRRPEPRRIPASPEDTRVRWAGARMDLGVDRTGIPCRADPFSVYAKGDDLLRQELSAMSPWHLRNIIRAYDLASSPSLNLETLTAEELIGVIMSGVRARRVADAKPSPRKSPRSSVGGQSG